MSARTRQPEPRVEVIVDDAFASRVLETRVERAAEAALDSERVSGPDHITIFITGDETLRDLNLRFNGLDEVTDVLSFNETAGSKTPRNERAGTEIAFPDTPDDKSRLGDIVISLPQVERQAAAAGQLAGRELAMLAIHGVLHLLGYDHADPDEERVMFGKTDRILASVFKDGTSPVTHPQMAQMTQVRTRARNGGRLARPKPSAASARAGNSVKAAPAIAPRSAVKTRAGGRAE